MPNVPVQFGEWRPDLATLDTQFANDVENVFPASNSYLPVPSLVPFADAVVPPPPSTERIVGLFSGRSTTGEWKIYAGTPTKLYTWTLLAGWTEIGSGYHVPEGERWSFAQLASGWSPPRSVMRLYAWMPTPAASLRHLAHRSRTMCEPSAIS